MFNSPLAKKKKKEADKKKRRESRVDKEKSNINMINLKNDILIAANVNGLNI